MGFLTRFWFCLLYLLLDLYYSHFSTAVFNLTQRVGVLLQPPRRDASFSKGYPSALSSLLPIYTPLEKEPLQK